MLTLIENGVAPDEFDPDSPVEWDPKQEEVYDFMVSRYQEDNDFLWNHLNQGGLVKVTNPLKIFPISPLGDNLSSYIAMDEEKLVIVGLASTVLTDIDRPSIRYSPYLLSFSRDNARRFLAIIVYNPETYQLI